MRRIVLVTPSADVRLFERYLNSSEFIGLDEGGRMLKQAAITPFAIISDFKTIALSEVLTFVPKNKVYRYRRSETGDIDEVINFISRNNPVEIIILTDLRIHLNILYQHLLTLTRKNITIELQDYQTCISYFKQGDHVVSKQHYSKMTIIPYPEARISLEHVKDPISSKLITFGKSDPVNTEISERIAVLKVLEGGVLVVLNNYE